MQTPSNNKPRLRRKTQSANMQCKNIEQDTERVHESQGITTGLHTVSNKTIKTKNMKYFISKSRIYSVEQNGTENKPLTIKVVVANRKKIEPYAYENAGALITSAGGVEKFLSLCVDEERYKKATDFHAYQRTDEYKAAEKARKEAAIKAKAEREIRVANEREEAYNALLSTGEAIESNFENIATVLKYLNTKNWGGWTLPTMTIGYTCNQYDCNGKTATTMKLDTPIEVDKRMIDKFVFGAPVGHLTKYKRIF